MTHATRAKRYRRLAEYIKRQPKENFYQSDYFCDTAACIAGHCALMLGARRVEGWQSVVRLRGKRFVDDELATRYLELGERERRNLFHYDAPWQTRDAAVKELLRRARAEERKARSA